MRKELAIFLLLVVLCAIVTALNPRFVSASNLQNTARLIGAFGIFSLGLGLVIISGGIDLSVGSAFALLGVLLSIMLTEWHVAVARGGADHACRGRAARLDSRLADHPPGAAAIHRHLVRAALVSRVSRASSRTTRRKGLVTRRDSRHCSGSRPAACSNVPTPFVLLTVIGAVMWVILHRSVYGRHLFATGRNETAARYSGVNTQRVVATAYVILGLLTGVAAIVFAFYTNSISPSSHGNFFELYGIAAAVLGGCSLRGGEGSVLGILLGTTLLQVLQNLVNLLGIPSSLNFAVMGGVILIGVVGDQVLQRRAARVRSGLYRWFLACQIPSSKSQAKPQTDRNWQLRRWRLVWDLGGWEWVGIWSLGFGI